MMGSRTHPHHPGVTMSTRDTTDVPLACASSSEQEPKWFETRQATLGSGMVIRRALPLRRLRMIGAWCFLDHFGPHSVDSPQDAMWVGPHPHTGLQTVTWLLDGEVLHRDSIGSQALIRPGQLNVMTSGRGISHTEETPQEHTANLHGVQFWVALPDAVRDMPPAFEQQLSIPVVEHDAGTVTVFFGRGFGAESPASAHTPIVGADLKVDGTMSLNLDPCWEYGVKSLDGPAEVGGRPLATGEVAFLPAGRHSVTISADRPTRLVIVGGEPFGEQILLWWNFVGRTQEEIVEYTRAWNDGDRFGAVEGFAGDRLRAPDLAGVRLR